MAKADGRGDANYSLRCSHRQDEYLRERAREPSWCRGSDARRDQRVEAVNQERTRSGTTLHSVGMVVIVVVVLFLSVLSSGGRTLRSFWFLRWLRLGPRLHCACLGWHGL